MEQFADELFGDGFNEYPLLLRPLVGTISLVIAGFKLFFYLLLHMALAFVILVIVAAVIGVIALLVTSKLPGFGDHGPRKKSDTYNRARSGVEHRLEAGEIKF
ncbi:hypothetical protein N7537_010211 [Penicillium hordei]|uniref:Uncharacterized protein n=1 Tax=Penicillium hordei TaxID=40994 RepID=A0AAD6DVR5_9EURO|nr:uncharacterized protein N7537_010211 [Penicillium hordei]KAJ5593307.1 hypothetical protein N7537_010211 [Penicillium hordei]